jgi:penicillin-binding protein 1B
MDGGLHRVALLGRGLALAFCVVPTAGLCSDLEDELGRTEIRVRSGAYPLVAGRTVAECALLERLERLGYARVHQKPDAPGEYFYGHEVFWIFRRAHRLEGREYAASLIGLRLRRGDGMILGAVGSGDDHALDDVGLLWLEPETLAESLDADRADRIRIRLDDLPEHAWRALLAAEDARFFDHVGVDAIALARATLANLKEGGVVQGGSTITQQLVKNRDLSPKRSLGRKVSEAVRALWLEAEYTKREILQAYLNQVYYGHVDGLAVHGIGTAARAYFSKPASRLDLGESALLAAIIQAPNRLSPLRHADRARARRDWVLSRLEELEWAEPRTVRAARASDVSLRVTPPRRSAPTHFVDWIADLARSSAEKRLEEGRGVVVEATLDPYLQAMAERAVQRQIDALRRGHRRLREVPITATLVALDTRRGDVLAYVGGEPARTDDLFDRARRARRQPGSTVKPFIMLEALDRCGERKPLTPASRIADRPLTLELPSGPWEPENADRRYLGVVDARTALAQSRNVPMVRVARWCGMEPTADMFHRAGIALPVEPPPSFVLGAVETTPLDLARAYTTLATLGVRIDPYPVRRIERPAGRSLAKPRPKRKRVVRRSTAYLVRDLMRSSVDRGTARGAGIEGLDIAAKTGSSSELRDAWFAGLSGSVVAVVWVGVDDGTPLGLSGATAAGPIWREFMATAAVTRPVSDPSRPSDVVTRWIDPRTGLLVRERHARARQEIFRKGALPRRNRFWRADRAVPVIE